MLCTALAALALRPGETVLTADLIERIWGAHPPPSAVATLRTYVMRLRRVLPPSRIRTVTGGYLLAVRRDETDLGRLRDLLRGSRADIEQDPASALRQLEEACALWRGTPLGGMVDCPLRTDELPRLEDLVLTATEERFTLQLTLGGHTDILDELSAAVTSHPLRERFAAQFMVALYRSGRRAEALVVYRDTRERFISELGVEPGAQLREAQLMVLRGDSDTAPAPGITSGGTDTTIPGTPRTPNPPEPAPHTPAASGAAAPPAPRAAEFVGREDEVQRLNTWLTDTSGHPVICLLDGQGGVGKSTLALRAAHDVASTFPDGVLYINLHGADTHNRPLDTDQALRLLLPALGVNAGDLPSDQTEQITLYHSRLNGRRVLLFLDNAARTEQVSALLPTTPGSAALVTSRAVLTGVQRGRYLHVEPLDTDDAVRLVQSVAVSSLDLGTPEEWRELARLCGHLPLALSILARRIAARPRWRMTEWIALLADERTRIGQFAAAGRDQDLRASLLVSVQQLAESDDPTARLAANLFPLLGVVPVRMHTAGSVAALVGRATKEAAGALERLTDAQITTSPRPGVHILHDMVRSAAAWQVTQMGAQTAHDAAIRLARWYLGTLYRVNRHLPNGTVRRAVYEDGVNRYPEGADFASQAEALTWLDGALREILTLAKHFSAESGAAGQQGTLGGGLPSALFVREACQALESFFVLRRRRREQRQLCELALTLGRKHGDQLAEAIALAQLGKLAGQQGDGARGAQLVRAAGRIYRTAGEEHAALMAEMSVVPCLGLMGYYQEALDEAHRLLAEYERAGFGDIWEHLNNLGRCYLYLGANEEALHYLLWSYRSANRPYPRALAAANITECHLISGDYPEAALWAERALAQTDGQPIDLSTEAHLYTLKAHALRRLGDEAGAQQEEAHAQWALDALTSQESQAVRLNFVSPEIRPAADSVTQLTG